MSAVPGNPNLHYPRRVLKIRAVVPQHSASHKYRHSSGFVVREGVVLTCAHGVVDSPQITISDTEGRTWTFLPDPDTLWVGDPDGPDPDRAPDLALLLIPGLGAGLRNFPLALLNRSGRSLRTLQEVQILGFPRFTIDRGRRNLFHEEGTVSLLGNYQSGLFDLALPTVPARESGTPEYMRSQWAGISGSPVILDDKLVGLVTEHPLPAGRSRLVANPLNLLDPRPGWGPGVQNPSEWWARLGVDDPARLPTLPWADLHPPPWVDDMRTLAEALQGPDVVLPAALRDPVLFAGQAHDVVLENLHDLDGLDLSSLARRLRQVWVSPTSSDGPSWYAVPSKAPVSTQSVVAALDHLTTVYRVAAVQGSGLLGRLRFRLPVGRLDLTDLRERCERWVHQAEDTGAARDVLARTDLVPGREPYGELLAHLWNAPVPETSVLLRSMIDMIVTQNWELIRVEGTAGASPGDAGLSPTRMLSGADVQPATVLPDSNGFLVNEQPTLSHLRRGDFAPTEVLDAVENAYWNWYEQEVTGAGARAGCRIPVFWLTGPSGAGKSILLIQLLARLNELSGTSVVLVDSGSNQFGQAAAQARSLASGRHVVIGVDDPMVAARDGSAPAWREALDALAQHRRSGDISGLPVLLCCAPTEHFERFRQDHFGEFLIGQFEVDPYDAQFVHDLRSWYEERTGETARPSSPEGSSLPAQLFFEWWKGEGVTAFAHRFRRRIDTSHVPELAEFFNRLLAVNRLYVGYPTEAVEALSPEGRDVLVVFQRDMHIDHPIAKRSGYWLSHPHLANIFYDVWFPARTCRHVRTGHLQAALEDFVEVDDKGWASRALLEELLATLHAADRRASAGRIDAADVRAALRTAGAAVRSAAPGLADPVLALWVRVEQHLPGGLSGWSPLAMAAERVKAAPEDRPHLRFLVLTLAELRHPTTDDALWTFLRGVQRWQTWISTATTLSTRPFGADEAEVVVRAVRSQVQHPEAIDLLTCALRQRPSDATLLAVAQDLLEGGLESNASLAPLALFLFGRGGRNQDLAVDWTTDSVRRENGEFFAAVLDQPGLPLIVLNELVKWLKAYPTESTADVAFVHTLNWRRLQDPEYREALERHLQERGDLTSAALIDGLCQLLTVDNSVWTYVFSALPSVLVCRPSTRALALSWLVRNRDAPGWHRVYVHLCQSAPAPDAELFRTGERQLPRAWHAGRCAHILGAMISCASVALLPEASRTSRRWMDEHRDDEGWGYLAHPVLQATPAVELEAAATDFLAWCKEFPDRHSASYVLRALLGARLSAGLKEEVVDYVDSWLRISRPGWGHVFLDCASSMPEDRRLALAMPWLERSFTHERWAAVFAAVLDQLSPDEAAALARAWFCVSTGADSTAGFLWSAVLERGPCPDLVHDPWFRGAVNAWLATHGLQRSWWHIWREMHVAAPSDMDTVRAALETEVATERAYGVANALRRTVVGAPDLAPALWGLLQTCERGRTWQLTWLALADEAPDLTCWRLGMSHLPQLVPQHFGAWWERLWTTFPGAQHRMILQERTADWLAAHADEPGVDDIRLRVQRDVQDGTSPSLSVSARPPVPAVRPSPSYAPARGSPSASDENARAVPQRLRFSCPRCQSPIEVAGAGRQLVRRIVCVDCAAHLSVDTESTDAELLGTFVRRPARIIGYKGRGRNVRAVVHCDECGSDLTAKIHQLDLHIAVDERCGALHELPDVEWARWYGPEVFGDT